ncbi:MAG TPA: hypothetical protein VE971_00100 [Candidatus Eisenbacteria bacterium]|nr:hypothetical protein [Candidatus Eisenbacteria bacterium]
MLGDASKPKCYSEKLLRLNSRYRKNTAAAGPVTGGTKPCGSYSPHICTSEKWQKKSCHVKALTHAKTSCTTQYLAKQCLCFEFNKNRELLRLFSLLLLWFLCPLMLSIFSR